MKKYNLSKIMKDAWTKFRSSEKTFSECLHDAWVAAKMLLVGNLWEKYGKSRIYFDYEFLKELMGLDIDTYKTGNICYASINGEKISNAEGGRWICSLDRFHFDLQTGKFDGQGNHFDEVKEKVKSFLGM